MTEPWVCFDEKFFRDYWGLGKFVLIHDGPKDPIQFELPKEEVRHYVKKYQWYIDGKPVHTFLTFVYDLRKRTVKMEWSIKNNQNSRVQKEVKELRLPDV